MFTFSSPQAKLKVRFRIELRRKARKIRCSLYDLILLHSNPMRKGDETLKNLKFIIRNFFHLPLQTSRLNPYDKLHEVLIVVESLYECTLL